GLCPLETTAEPNQRGQCLTDTSLPGKTPSTQTGNSGGSGTTTNTGTGGTTSTPMTTPMKAGGGTTTGPGTTTTTTSAKTTTTTTTPKQTRTTTSGSTGTPTSTYKATTTKIINNKNVVRGPSAPASGSLGTKAPFITYVNTINKITIKYPPTWTKTELTGNPSIPVIFNAPTTITTATGNAGPAAAAKNSFVISITPSASNLDNFTQQRINALTHSNGVKYNITNATAKVLTPPTGITAYREVSYDATKNILVNNTTIPTQVPLKGAAIFFVNSGTGYSLLYLAKQTEYTQNLPMIQQMVNSFQVGNGGGTAANGAGVH
ncbi:MAG: hypothetical protein WCF23_11530, partial [Candidatus Nitrosopolaris sp.]